VKKFKKSAYAIAVCAAFALTMQAPAAAGGHDRGVDAVLNHALNKQHGGRQNKDLFLFQNGEFAGSRKENRIFRMENRIGVNTAASINAMQAQRPTMHSIRLNNLNLNGLPTDLDLKSKRDNYVLGTLNGNVTITRGGESVVVDGSTKLTAAEIAAVYQVLGEGGQSLTLGKKGNAEGGSLALDAAAVNGLTGLSIPKNVTITGDFAAAQQLGINGDLHNAGNLLVTSSDPSVLAATINATNIRNTRSGNIGTIDAGSNTLDLNLFASMDIVNHGRIAGNGNVNLTAGGSILNVREPGSSADDLAPTITAGRNLSLQSSNIANQGILAATTGNINIADQLQSGVGNHFIVVNGQGGTISAVDGDITIGSNSFVETDKIVLAGGDYLSKKLLLNAGEGSIYGTVGDVTGQVKTSAGAAHFGVSTGNLDLGQSVITGDPTFFNDAGQITISGNLIYGEAITILASGDIRDNGFPFVITTQGSPVTLIAGAKLKALGGAQSESFAEDGRQITQGSVSVSGASKTGGSIDVSNTPISTVDASGGGDVTIIAFASKTGGGIVELGGIDASGSGSGNNGSVTVYAGSAEASSVTINAPSITTGNGTGTAGNISLVNSQPKIKMTYDVTGAGVGSISPGKLVTGNILTGPLTAHGGTINISTAGSASLGFFGGATSVDGLIGSDAGFITVTAGTVNLYDNLSSVGGNGFNVPLGGFGTDGGAGGDITLTATDGRINIFNSTFIESRGGDGGAASTASAPGSSAGNAGAGGRSGNILLTATQDINLTSFGIASLGGNGGTSSNGADGDSTAINGGSGGNGGAGGDSGNISITSDGFGIGIDGFVRTIGGIGTSGGLGGAADTVVTGGSGGAGGDGGFGGSSGDIAIINAGSFTTLDANVISQAGVSGSGGNGGTGSDAFSGSAGAAGNGADGSNSGNITIVQSNNGDITFGGGVSIGTVAGGGGAGGIGGNGINGGSGADGGIGARGGSAGQILMTNSGFGDTFGDVTSQIFAVGGVGGNGGDGGFGGGSAGTGGNGGNGGNSLGNGNTGSITIDAPDLDFTGIIAAASGSGTAVGGNGGNGSANAGATGGNGGNGGIGGNGSSGGTITVTGGNLNLGTVLVGGSAGYAGGFGGAFGSNAGSTDGSAGSGGNGGNAGSGGLITISGSLINASVLFADGGTGGQGGNGNSASNSNVLSQNGDGGDSGAQGGGGSIVLSTKGKGTPDVNVTSILASGGAGSTSGSGGTTASRGGGAAGAIGQSANGGTVSISSARDINLTDVSLVGGSGGISGIAESEAAGANGVAGGAGGSLFLTTKKGNIFSVNTGTLNFSGGSGSDGGNNGSNFSGAAATGGSGGNAGLLTVTAKGNTNLSGGVVGVGGAGGQGGLSGSGGVAVTGGTGGVGGTGGDVSVKAAALEIDSMSLNGGAGGNAGPGGFGADETAGGDGGTGGAGGTGGSFITEKMKGNIVFSGWSAEGGAGGLGGAGGSGGPTVNPTGTDGGNGGIGGSGGFGGQFQIITKGSISTSGAVSAQGGDAGDGGNGGNGGAALSPGLGGNGGDGGNGAQGGSITSSTALPFANANGGAGGDGGSGGAGTPAGLGGFSGGDGLPGTVTP